MGTPLDTFGGGVAVITGAAAGIGEGLALHAALELGMSVALADIDEAGLEQVRERIATGGGTAIAVPTDVRDPEALVRLADRTEAELGPVRLLVNNAGIEQFGYLWDVPVENWRRLVDINVSGVFYGVRAFLPRLIARPEPAWVLNLSSIGGVSAAPRQAPYIMSKHAVLGLTESLSLETQLAAPHVHVAAVLPGAVASRIFLAAGGVEGGDAEVAEAERAAMLDILPHAMPATEAAAVILEQAAAGEFYIVTHPDVCLGAMQRRAETLANRRAPELRDRRRPDELGR